MECNVSFVVIAYNEAENIGRTLDSITGLMELDSYEIIVVNDGSKDNTAAIVEGRKQGNPCIKLIDLPQNRGRGYARHTGVKAAEGELIATVDADITLPRDWLIHTKAALLEHDGVGGVAIPDGDANYVYQKCRLAPRIVPHAMAITGNNALYRRHVFELVEFDPSLREGEDVVLNHATNRQGLSLITVPGLHVEHQEHKSFLQSIAWLFVSGKGATRQLLAYRQIRMPDLATFGFWGVVAAGVLVAVHGSPMIGSVVPIIALLGVSTQHVRSRFEISWRRAASVFVAIIINSALMLAYFTGRLIGFTLVSQTWAKAAELRHNLTAGDSPDAPLAAKRLYTTVPVSL